jgi:exodeoxyribonuclease V alpha subunit
MGLYNGDTGLAWPDAHGRLKVWFPVDGGGVKEFSPQRLPEHRTAFAMTVHKSQGSEFDQTLLILPDRDSAVLSRELIYTGCTRARRQLTLIAQDEIVKQAVSRNIRRTSGLIDALDPDNE